MTGTGPRNRTVVFRLSGGGSAFELGRSWQGRLDSNQGHPTSEAGVLPLNYAPSVWRFPSVTIGALRFFRPALSPDQLEKHALVPPASIRTGALLITRQVLCQLSYAGHGGSASIRTKDVRVMSPALWPAKLRNLVLGGGTDPPTSCLWDRRSSIELTERGRRDRTRTCGFLIKSQLLFPLSYAP